MHKTSEGALCTCSLSTWKTVTAVPIANTHDRMLHLRRSQRVHAVASQRATHCCINGQERLHTSDGPMQPTSLDRFSTKTYCTVSAIKSAAVSTRIYPCSARSPHSQSLSHKNIKHFGE